MTPITEEDIAPATKLPRNCLLCNKMPIPPRKDGMYFDVPEEEYHQIAAASQSLLKKPTPMHMRAYLDGAIDFEDTDATTFGTNLHARVFEPLRFAKECVDGPINPKTEKPYGAETKAYAEFVADHPGKLILGRGDRNSIESAAKNIEAHDTLGAAFKRGKHEVTIIWTCPTTGMAFKARLDCLTPEDVLDLKTSRGLSERFMQTTILDRGYDVQGACYLWGLKVLGQPRLGYGIGWVENAAPFAVRGVMLGEETLAIGHSKLITGRDRLARAIRLNEWDGYPGGMPIVELPKFEIDKYKNEGID